MACSLPGLSVRARASARSPLYACFCSITRGPCRLRSHARRGCFGGQGVRSHACRGADARTGDRACAPGADARANRRSRASGARAGRCYRAPAPLSGSGALWARPGSAGDDLQSDCRRSQPTAPCRRAVPHSRDAVLRKTGRQSGRRSEHLPLLPAAARQPAVHRQLVAVRRRGAADRDWRLQAFVGDELPG